MRSDECKKLEDISGSARAFGIQMKESASSLLFTSFHHSFQATSFKIHRDAFKREA